MKQILILLFILLAVTACGAPQATIVPVDTAVAMTRAALPKTDTPTLTPSDTPVPSPTIPIATDTPAIPPAVGAQCVPPDTERADARVARVVDGDTIEVAIGNAAYTVRYLGIDAPEIAPNLEYFGLEAQAENKRLVTGQVVVLVKSGTGTDADPEGRLLRYVFSPTSFVNYDLILNGYAIAVANAIDVSCQQLFLEAEREAANAQRGFWKPTPTPTFTATPTRTPTPLFSPTPSAEPPCDCEGRRLSCNSFSSQADAQACFDYCKSQGFGDVFGMDNNRNGRACEGLP